MSLLTLVIEVDIETNDQPESDVRRRLANVDRRVSVWIKHAVLDAVTNTISVFSPESYFPDWPEGGKGAAVKAYRMRTRRV